MNIGIIGYFNPYEVIDFLDKNQSIPSINTMASSVNATVRGLLQQGHCVKVFTTYPDKGKSYSIKGENIEIFLTSRYPSIKGTGVFNRLYMINRLKKILKPNIYDLDVLHAQWTYDFALAAKQFAHIIPVFCTVRDWCPYIYSLARGLKGRLYWYISLKIFRKVMKGNKIHFVANSDYTRNQIIQDYPQKQIEIIHNPIMKENILSQKQSYSKNPIFISISQTLDDPRKNIEKLLYAFKQYNLLRPNSRLVLVGEYSSLVYQKWASCKLLKNVTLTGKLAREELFKELDKATVLIHPSKEETFGNILLEGMARCLPCIGGENSGAVPKVLGYGKYGILCNIDNIDSIVEAMNKTEDVIFVKELTSVCTEYLIHNFQNDTIALQHINLYNKILNKYVF